MTNFKDKTPMTEEKRIMRISFCFAEKRSVEPKYLAD